MSLRPGQLIAYGLPGLPLALLGLPLVIYLPVVYAETHALGLAVVGGILLISRLWDLFTDPLVGYLGDRLAWPRKRLLLMLAGTPALLLAVHELFLPSGQPEPAYLLFWTLVLYTGWTLVVMPYSAWGAEISSDYRERSHVTAAREGWILLGTLGAVLLPAGFGLNDAESLRLLGLVFIVLFVLSLAPLWWLPHPAKAGLATSAQAGRGLWLLRSNRPLRHLLLAFLLNGIANGIPAALFLLFVEHVLGSPDEAWRYLAIYFCAGLLGFALWLPIARRLGKHRGWALSMLFACLIFIWVPAVPHWGPSFFILICLLTGLSLGVDMSLPASIQADVIDLDRAQGGGERAGLFFGLWGMATKLALALAIGIAFPLIEFAGFDPSSPNPDVSVLLFAYALLPIPFKLLAAGLVWNFPLNQAALDKLQRNAHDDTHTQTERRTTDHPVAAHRLLDHEA
jgi:Na+/melibiose symporter-like transporter